MPEMDQAAKYNRTLDMELAPVPYAHFEARKDVFRQNGVRTAYTFREKAFIPIMYREMHFDQGPARDFRRSATPWELTHSKIPFGDGHGSVYPVVDGTGLVVGHYGTFDSNDIFVPADIPASRKEERVSSHGGRMVFVPGFHVVEIVRTTLGLNDYLELGADVIAERNGSTANYLRRGYTTYPTPQTSFGVITDVEGHVLLVASSRNKDGVKASAVSPLDLITIVRLVTAAAVAAIGTLAIRTLIRRRAAKALAEAAKRELTSGSGSEIATEIVTTLTRRVGSLSAREMEQYLAEVLKARPDLRRLIAARVMTGQRRMDAINIALREFESTQGWKVVHKTAKEMEAVTTPGNIVHMRNGTKELWINKERAIDPEKFYQHTVHDLAAHALAGRGGILTGKDLPFIGHDFTTLTNGLGILEHSITRYGHTDWIRQTFSD